MDITIHPSKISGTLSAISSKSYSHRALIAASLCSGTTTISHILKSDDITITHNALEKLGIVISEQDDTLTVKGNGGIIYPPKKDTNIYLHHSGTSARFITAICALSEKPVILTGSSRLKKRPIKPLCDALETLGTRIEYLEENGYFPIQIQKGQKRTDTVEIDSSVSSQFLSALLLIAPTASISKIQTTRRITSKPYIDMTIDSMKIFGVDISKQNGTFIPHGIYKPTHYTVEGDYSASSYALAAAAITQGNVIITNLSKDSLQADTEIVPILQEMGCDITQSEHAITLSTHKPLQSITKDMSTCPDIVQTVAALSCYGHSQTKITHIENLVHKESNRIVDTATELINMGAHVSHTHNTLTIQPQIPTGGEVYTHDDHRIAMMAAITSLGAHNKTIIHNADVVSKSYPNFFSDLASIGATISYE